VLARGKGFQVKRLEVSPGHRFSLQFHRRRSEHWVVVAGTGRVVIGARTLRASPGRALFIPKRTKHRLQNTGRTPLVVIEVQRGDYLGEDDIIRLADDYARL
jgi:mannose-6-phosphate isomerase-like protein (cupin superfamily)